LNGDGHPDLVTASSVLLGNGDGTFRVGTDFYAGPSVAIGDLNGDGRPDMVAPTNGEPSEELPAVRVRLGNGDGTFGPPTGFGMGYYTGAAAIADFNADGRPDIAVAHSFDRETRVSVLLGNGDGTFGTQRVYDTG